MTSALSWREFWKPLTTSFRVTLLDNRGIGRSPNCESPYAIHDMAQDTLETLTDLDIEKFPLFSHFEIEGAGHGIHVEKPAILAQDITNFL